MVLLVNEFASVVLIARLFIPWILLLLVLYKLFAVVVLPMVLPVTINWAAVVAAPVLSILIPAKSIDPPATVAEQLIPPIVLLDMVIRPWAVLPVPAKMPLNLALAAPLIEKVIDGALEASTDKSPIVFPETVAAPFKTEIAAFTFEVVADENEMFLMVLLLIVDDDEVPKLKYIPLNVLVAAVEIVIGVEPQLGLVPPMKLFEIVKFPPSTPFT